MLACAPSALDGGDGDACGVEALDGGEGCCCQAGFEEADEAVEGVEGDGGEGVGDHGGFVEVALLSKCD